MKRLFSILFLLLFAQQAALADPGGWDGDGLQILRYPVIGPSGVFTEHLGDGSTSAGGVAPYYTNGMPTNISAVTTGDEVAAGGNTTGTDEYKVRLTLYSDHVLSEDTLVFHCLHNATHPHEFNGAVKAGGCSTYAQLRNDCIAQKAAGKLAATNPGPTINCSAYWHALLLDCGTSTGPLGTGTVSGALGDGVCRGKKDLLVPLYYEPGLPVFNLTNAATYSLLPLGIGEVFGHNMGDPWQLRERAAIAAQNAADLAAGGSGSTYQDSDPMALNSFGFTGWSCYSPGGALRSAGVQVSMDDLDCSAGDTLVLELHSQSCWDGHNGNSPDGRSHVSYAVTAIATNGNFRVCPYDGYKVPELVDKPQWILHSAISSSVANDSPFLSSDAAFQAKARADAGRCVTATAWGSSATVCAPGGAATFVCKPGCSAHADYEAAWDGAFFWLMFNKCTATPIPVALTFSWIPANRTPEGTACNSNTISMSSGAEKSLVLSSLVTVPTSTTVDGSSIDEYYPIPLAHMGPGTMHP